MLAHRTFLSGPLALALWILVAALACVAAPAAAQTTSLLGVTGDDVGLTTDVEEGVRAGLREAAGREAVPAGVGDLDEALMLIGCPTASPDCLSSLSELLAVESLVFGRVVESDEGLSLSLTGFDATAGTWSFSSNVPLFDGADARRIAEDATRALLEDAPVLVVTGPPGAVVLDRGVRRPLPTVIPANGVVSSWDVEVGDAVVGVVRAPAGGGARVARVQPEAPAPVVVDTDDGEAPSTLRITGWSLAGVSVVLSGATLAQGLATARTQRAFDRTRIQRDAHDLADQGASQARTTNTLLGFTVATTVAAGTLLVIDYTRGGEERDATARPRFGVAPTRGGAHGALGWTF